MKFSSTTITGAVLLLIMVVAISTTWLVLERRAAQIDAEKRNAHPLRVISNTTASTSLFDNAGNPTSLAQYAESWTIITSWASWCPVCHGQLETISAVKRQFGDSITAIAFNRTEPQRTIDAYTGTNPLPKNLVSIRDTTDVIFQQFEGYAMPETIIVSPEGTVVHHFRGVVSEETLVQTLHGALNSN